MKMNTPTRLILAIVVAVIVGFGFMFYDKSRGAEWVVSPQQIEQAKAEERLASKAVLAQLPCFLSVVKPPMPFPSNGQCMVLLQGSFAFFSGRKRKKA
jgi:hypothetical protein